MSVTQRLIFDPTAADFSANVGAHVRAGDDGALVGSKDIDSENWLNVAAALHDGDGNPITNLNPLTVALDGTYEEDSAHTSGDSGVFSLSVRADDLSNVPAGILAGTEGDYQAFVTGPDGALYVAGVDFDIRDLNAAADNVAAYLADGAGTALTSTADGLIQALDVHVANAGEIDIDDDLADTAIENTSTAVSTTAVDIVATALADRKHLYLANEGKRPLYFGKTGVTTANGFPLHMGEKLVVRVGPSVTPQAIGAIGASNEDLRVMELA